MTILRDPTSAAFSIGCKACGKGISIRWRHTPSAPGTAIVAPGAVAAFEQPRNLPLSRESS